MSWELGRASIVDPLTVAMALAAGVLLIRYRVNSAWLMAGGGTIGVAAHLLAG